MSKMYNVTREVAAKSLNISTRTIDRYIKSGKLSYKKIANKVLLAKEEVIALKQEFATLHQELSTEIINQSSTANTTTLSNKGDLENAIDQKVEKFFLYTGQNMNFHGILGVSITSFLTCKELLGHDWLYRALK